MMQTLQRACPAYPKARRDRGARLAIVAIIAIVLGMLAGAVWN